jgi:hypothetical protein
MRPSALPGLAGALLISLNVYAEPRFLLQRGLLPRGPMEDLSARIPERSGGLEVIQVGRYSCELERQTQLYEESIWVHQVLLNCIHPEWTEQEVAFGVTCNTGSKNRDKGHLKLREREQEWLLSLRCESRD